MANQAITAKQIQAKLARFQLELQEIQEAFEDFVLTKDDLNAILAGQRDYRLKRTRRL